MRRALQTTRPSVPQTEVARLRRMCALSLTLRRCCADRWHSYDSFVSARSSDGGLPNGEASDAIGGRSSLM